MHVAAAGMANASIAVSAAVWALHQPRRSPRVPSQTMATTTPSKAMLKGKERAIRMQARGQQLSQKADYLLVCQALKYYPEQVTQLKSKFLDLKIISASGEVRIPESDQLAAENKPSPAKEEDHFIELDGLPSNEQNIHRNFLSSWSLVPPKTLRVLITILEPVSLSKFALKALIPKGCKELPRAIALQILQYLLELNPNGRVTHGGNVRKIAVALKESDGIVGTGHRSPP